MRWGRKRTRVGSCGRGEDRARGRRGEEEDQEGGLGWVDGGAEE